MSLNEEVAEELHKQVIKNFKTERVYARILKNIWQADLAETGSLFSKNDRCLQICNRCLQKSGVG